MIKKGRKPGEGGNCTMRYGFLFGAGAEVGYGLPSGGKFALDIFRQDTTESKKEFKAMRDSVDSTTTYASNWLPRDYIGRSISSFGKSVFQNIIKDTVEHKRSHIVQKLNAFDETARKAADKLQKEGIDSKEVMERLLKRRLDNLHMNQSVAFISEFAEGNQLFYNSYFAAFLLIYKDKDIMAIQDRPEFRKIILSILQLQIGALSEELTRKINDGIFQKKDDDIDVFDDLGEIIQLNYSASGIIGMEYLMEMREPDKKTDSGKILYLAQTIMEDIYASVLDYKSLIDSNWHYLYSPSSDWAKFCKISIFLLTVRSYILSSAAQADLTKSDGYYNLLKKAMDDGKFEVSTIATTNYNTFIQKIVGQQVAYLNGSTEMWYDPYLNRIGEKSSLNAAESHLLVPLMFTQSGTKPMTSIDMSVQYVDTFRMWQQSDAVVVAGFGFGTDDEHINGILRTLIDVDGKRLIVVRLFDGKTEEEEAGLIGDKLKVSRTKNIKVILVDASGTQIGTQIKWTESLLNKK